eukprot:gene6787-13746_t
MSRIFVLLLGGILGLYDCGTASDCQKVFAPAYFYPSLWEPSDYWYTLLASSRGGIAIINPENGPTNTIISEYKTAVNYAKKSGITIIGYVYTSYGSRDRHIVKQDVDKYINQYKVDGIFFDEVSSSKSALPYYSDIASYVRNISLSMVVAFNPGVTPNRGYIDIADITVIFEDSYQNYIDNYSAPGYINYYPTSKFAHLIYGVKTSSDMNRVLRLSFARRAGNLFITDDLLPNPWDTLPPYYTSEVIDMGFNCGNCNINLTSQALHWLESRQIANSGLLVSYDAPATYTWTVNRAYAYDQAVAAIALLLNANTNSSSSSHRLQLAEKILNGIQTRLQLSNPTSNTIINVPFYWDASSSTSTTFDSTTIRSGTAAWVGQAFAMHWLVTGKNTYSMQLQGICHYLQNQLMASGSNNCVRGGPDVTWCSTEHNIDSYFVLHLTSYLTNNSSYLSSAEIISQTLRDSLWNTGESRFNQGLGDTYRALDTQSWGAVWLRSNHQTNISDINSKSRASSALIFADSYFLTSQKCILREGKELVTGYGPYADNSNSLHATTVWSEGTLGVALAYLRKNNNARMRSVILDILPMITPAGAMLYSANKTVVDSSGEVFYPLPSVAGTAWFALVCSPVQYVFWNANISIYETSFKSFATGRPTKSPTVQTAVPTTSRRPSTSPTSIPTKKTSRSPSVKPSRLPTLSPSRLPTRAPSTIAPTSTPSSRPTKTPSMFPTIRPTRPPTMKPTKSPSRIPTTRPSKSWRPTRTPTNRPTSRPTRVPSVNPRKSSRPT